MTTPRRLALTLSPDLYGRLEARAAAERLDPRQWVERVLLAALTRSKTRGARDRNSRRAGLELLSMLAGRLARDVRPPKGAGHA